MTLNCGSYGKRLMMGLAGFLSSTVGLRVLGFDVGVHPRGSKSLGLGDRAGFRV